MATDESQQQGQHYDRLEDWADSHPHIIASISALVLMALGPIAMNMAQPRFGEMDWRTFGLGLVGSLFYAALLAPFMLQLVEATLGWLSGGVP